MGVGHWWIMLALSYVTYTKCPATGYYGCGVLPYASARYIGSLLYRQRAYVMGSGVATYVGTYWPLP